MTNSFDPYYQWLAIPPEDQPPNHYRLLGVRFLEQNPDVISVAADRQMVHVKSFQAGPHGALSQRLLNEIAAAKICLLNPVSKAAYDQRLIAQQQGVRPGPLPMAKPVEAPVAVQPAPPPEPTDSSYLGADPPAFPRRARQRQAKKSPGNLAAVIVPGVVLAAAAFLYWMNRPADKPPEDAKKTISARSVDAGSRPPPAPKSPKPAARPEVDDGAVSAQVDREEPVKSESTDDVQEEPAGSPSTEDVSTAQADSDEPQEPASDAEGPSEAGQDNPVEQPAAAIDYDSLLKPAASAATPRAEVPSAADQQKAKKVIKDVYAEEFKQAKRPADKLALADKLAAQARATDDLAEKFALLSESRDLGLAAGGVDQVMRAVEELIRIFDVDAATTMAETTETLGNGNISTAARATLTDDIAGLIDRAVAKDAFEAAERMAKTGISVARKNNDLQLSKKLVARRVEIVALGKSYARAKTAIEKLKVDPGDSAANLAVGSFLCFVRRDWITGLPLLVQGDDKDLQALAEVELKGPTAPQDRVQVADRWWDLANRADLAAASIAIRDRSVVWYRRALPRLTGLEKSKAEKRIAQMVQETTLDVRYLSEMEALEIVIWVLGEREKEPDIARKTLHGTQSIEGKTLNHSLSGHPPTDNKSFHVMFRLGRVYRELRGGAGIDEHLAVARTATPLTFRIVGDGVPLWASRPLTKKNESQHFVVNTAKVDKLEFFVDCPGSADYAHGVWIEPVVTKRASSAPGATKLTESDQREAPAAGGQPVYLDDLKEIDSHVGFGTVGRHGESGMSDVRGIKYKDTRITHALAIHAEQYGTAHITYALDAKYQKFHALVVINQNNSAGGSESPLTFSVIGDNRPLWRSKAVQRAGESQTCDVVVKGVRTLTLEVECAGPAHVAHSCWLEPRLSK